MNHNTGGCGHTAIWICVIYPQSRPAIVINGNRIPIRMERRGNLYDGDYNFILIPQYRDIYSVYIDIKTLRINPYRIRLIAKLL